MSALVYSYMRFSDPRQSTGHSGERQSEYAARWAAEHGLRLDASLTMLDEGLSAYHQKHVTKGAFGVFLAAVEEGRISAGSVLVVEALDRLSRAEPWEAQAQLAMIVRAGLTVVTASDNQVYSRETLKKDPMKLITSLVIMMRAHEESETKSLRVTAAIVKLCQNWVAGTYRGRIRNGKDPQWLSETPTGWELLPERVEALRRAISMYQAGHSGQSIARRLADDGVSPSDGPLSAPHFYQILRNENLIGTKSIRVGGHDFALLKYYPAVLSEEEWADVKAVRGDRGRRGAKSSIPHIITGLGITYCGYCAKAMSGQHLFGKIKVKGSRLKDGYRRLLCASKQYGAAPCPYPASRSVAPVERALMNYCSDIINLRALYGGDRAAPLRTELTIQRKLQAENAEKSRRLIEVMLSAIPGGTPAMLVKAAADLETEKEVVQRAIDQTEARISALARNNVDGIQAKWKELAKGVQELEYDARLQARQLVADTFSRIVVYATGVRPDIEASYTDIVLLAKGGTSRMLSIDKTGKWRLSEDVASS